MKKWLKIWMLAMAFLAAMTTVISTGKVNAETWDNKVTVEISPYNGGVNSCSWDDYQFNFSWSADVQTGTISWNINCIFWKHWQQVVSIALEWALTSEESTIATSQLKLKNGTWTWTPTDLGTQATDAANFVLFDGDGVSLFNKAANKIWDASGTNIEIQIVVPAWQPNGTYTGTLVLTF